MYFYLPDWPKLAKNQGFLKIGLFEKEALGTFYPELFTTGTHRTDPSTQARDTFIRWTTRRSRRDTTIRVCRSLDPGAR